MPRHTHVSHSAQLQSTDTANAEYGMRERHLAAAPNHHRVTKFERLFFDPLPHPQEHAQPPPNSIDMAETQNAHSAQ